MIGQWKRKAGPRVLERENRGQTEEGEKKMEDEDEPDLCGLK